jgi:hypothetical protein
VVPARARKAADMARTAAVLMTRDEMIVAAVEALMKREPAQ